MKKIKTYVLTVSKFFPSTHAKAGQPTGFVEKILNGEKIHTIRKNWHWWHSRVDAVNNGQAIISLRYWTGQAYNSPQIEFAKITQENNPIVQPIGWFDLEGGKLNTQERCYTRDSGLDFGLIATNDGLSVEDFKEWFKGTPLMYDTHKEELGIIHFTNFRY